MPKIGMEPLRRRALIDAAITEIGAQGSLDVTVARIARRAGMSPALAHHYFGSKDDMFAATMRHILAEFGAEVRRALTNAHTPRDRITAILRASFSPTQFHPDMIAAWLNFYVQAQTSPQSRRLLSIYQRRLHSNLHAALRALAPPAQAATLAHGLAAMIDGLYIRQALQDDPLPPETALAILKGYITTALPAAPSSESPQ